MAEAIKELVSLYNGEVQITFYPTSHLYKDANKKNLLSVSKISGIVDKSRPLIMWAIKLAKQYLENQLNGGDVIDQQCVEDACKQYTVKQQEALDAGHMVHEWVEAYSKGITQPYPENDAAQNGILAFLKWKTDHNVEFEISERLIYSREHNYVGRFDAVVKVDGKRYLVDYKTSKAFYAMEMGMQTAGYQLAYEEETGDKIDGRMILRFGKETGEFEVHPLEDYEADKAAFLAALTLTKRQKELDTYVKEW